MRRRGDRPERPEDGSGDHPEHRAGVVPAIMAVDHPEHRADDHGGRSRQDHQCRKSSITLTGSINAAHRPPEAATMT